MASPERKPRGVSKHIRKEKARIRREYAPTASYISEMQERAYKKLAELDLRLHTYVLNSHVDKEALPHIYDTETSLTFGEKVAQKITSESKTQPVTVLGNIASQFVEKTWVQSGLELINREDIGKIINSFLNACPENVQKYLEESGPGHDLTLLQQVKNRVINPITGQMDIK